jgi:hypothetical protein
MRDLTELDDYRLRDASVLKHFGSYGGADCGAFMVPYPRTGVSLRILAASGEGWDHVSVSLPDRVPNWYEMQFVHRTFFKSDEIAWEYHMPQRKHINIHPFVLHLWRKKRFKIPVPPGEFV